MKSSEPIRASSKPPELIFSALLDDHSAREVRFERVLRV